MHYYRHLLTGVLTCKQKQILFKSVSACVCLNFSNDFWSKTQMPFTNVRIQIVLSLRLAYCREIVSQAPKKTATFKLLKTLEWYLEPGNKKTPGIESTS